MSFSENIDQPGCVTFLYMFVHGLPYCWSTARFPEKWQYPAALDGQVHHPDGLVDEVWDWSQTLYVESFNVDRAINPWAGSADAPAFNPQIAVDDWWLSAMSRSLYRSDAPVCQLVTDSAAAAAIIEVDGTTGFDTSGHIYIGTETVYHTGKTATTFTGCDRGAYLSPPTRWIADWPDESEVSSGPIISTRPLTMKGRRVDVWVGTGRYDSEGNLVPYGATPCTTEDKVFSYIINNTKLNNTLTHVTIESTGIVDVIQRTASNYLPSSLPAAPNDLVFCDSKYKKISRSKINMTLYTTAGGTYNVEYRFTGTATDYYLVDDIEDLILPQLVDLWSPDLLIRPVLRSNTDGECWGVRIQSSRALDKIIIRNWSASTPGQQLEPFFKCLFDFDNDIEITVDSVGTIEYVPESGARYVYNIPSGYSDIGHVILFPAIDTWPVFTPDSNITPAAGENPYNGVIKLDDEMLGVVVSSKAYRDIEYYHLTVVQRGVLGSSPDEHKLEYDDDFFDEDNKITQSIALQNCPWPAAIKTLLCGGRQDGGAYGEQAWYGYGAMVPDSWVDISDITDTRPVTIVLHESENVINVIESILVAYQHCISVNSGGNVTFVKLPLPNEDPLYSIDHTCIDTVSGVDWDMPDDMIISQIRCTEMRYDHGAESGSEMTITNGVARSSFGTGSVLDISCKNLPWWISDDSSSDLLGIASDMFVYWGSPYLIVEVVVNNSVGLLVSPGDQVALSHSLLPDILTASRGIDNYNAIVARTDQRYYGSSGDVARIKLLVTGISGFKYGGYSPVMEVTAVANSAGNCRLTVRDEFYNLSGEPSYSFFGAGQSIVVYKMFDRSGASLTGSIVSITHGSPTYVMTDIPYISWTLGSSALICNPSWGSCDSDQQEFVHLARPLHPVLLGANDPPFRYS